MMRLLFSSDPMNPRRPDADYADEVAAAPRIGLDFSLVRFEALGDVQDTEVECFLYCHRIRKPLMYDCDGSPK